MMTDMMTDDNTHAAAIQRAAGRRLSVAPVMNLEADCLDERRLRRFARTNQHWLFLIAFGCFILGFMSQVFFFSKSLHNTLPDGLRARLVLDSASKLVNVEIKPADEAAAGSLRALASALDPAPATAAATKCEPCTSTSTGTSSISSMFGTAPPSGVPSRQLLLDRVRSEVVPSIVRAWREAKLDWHELLPKHNSKWERYGTPERGKGLQLLVNKETQVTDFLTRYQESGLSSMYGFDHGPLLAHSGCDEFLSPCMVHPNAVSCAGDDFCMWAPAKAVCVDRDASRADTGAVCPNPTLVRGGGELAPATADECKFYVHQPVVLVSVDSESQSMFYHWWASFCMIMDFWRTTLQSTRTAHFFVKEINDPAFFQFFGFLADGCWRRAIRSFVHVPPGACLCQTHALDAQQARTDPDKAVQHMLGHLGLQNVEPPARRAKVGLISRRRKRFILNEYELVAAVERLGYECVLLPFETMTLHEQMQQLRSLDVMVGMHGSGLDNAVFLHPGSVMVQLLPYKCDHRCTFPATAEQAGVHYQVRAPLWEGMGVGGPFLLTLGCFDSFPRPAPAMLVGLRPGMAAAGPKQNGPPLGPVQRGQHGEIHVHGEGSHFAARAGCGGSP